MGETKYLIFQCRGTVGALEKDVGVVIKIRDDRKEIFCPHYHSPKSECIKPDKKCIFEKITYY